jgi:LemA protein
MKQGLKVSLIVTGVLFLVLALSVIFTYNSLVKGENSIESEYANIESRMTERQATITQLVSVVTGLAAQEQAIIDAITSSREAYFQAKNSGDLDGMIDADAEYVSNLSTLLGVIVEDYPAIASASAFEDLMVTISGIESALYVARRDYNEAVADYNESVKLFPKVLIANMFNFPESKEYWKLAEGADEIPEIDFGDYAD